MLNSVSRSLSEVGLTPSHFGVFSRRPLNAPAITRKRQLHAHAEACALRHGARRAPSPDTVERGLQLPRRPGRASQARSPDLNQPELFLPLPLHERLELCGEPALLYQAPRFVMRRLHDVAIAHQVAGAKLRKSRLTGAEDIARSAQFEVALGDDEPVACLRHRLQALACVVAPRRLI